MGQFYRLKYLPGPDSFPGKTCEASQQLLFHISWLFWIMTFSSYNVVLVLCEGKPWTNIVVVIFVLQLSNSQRNEKPEQTQSMCSVGLGPKMTKPEDDLPSLKFFHLGRQMMLIQFSQFSSDLAQGGLLTMTCSWLVHSTLVCLLIFQNSKSEVE